MLKEIKKGMRIRTDNGGSEPDDYGKITSVDSKNNTVSVKWDILKKVVRYKKEIAQKEFFYA